MLAIVIFDFFLIVIIVSILAFTIIDKREEKERNRKIKVILEQRKKYKEKDNG